MINKWKKIWKLIKKEGRAKKKLGKKKEKNVTNNKTSLSRTSNWKTNI